MFYAIGRLPVGEISLTRMGVRKAIASATSRPGRLAEQTYIVEYNAFDLTSPGEAGKFRSLGQKLDE